MFFGKPSIFGFGNGGFPVFIKSRKFLVSVLTAALLGYAGQAAAVSFTVGGYALGLSAFGGSFHSVVHGYNVSCVWDMPGDLGVGFVRESGTARFFISTLVFDSYGLMVQRRLGSEVKIGIGVSQTSLSLGGFVINRGFTYDLQARVPIKKFDTASLGVMAGISYINMSIFGGTVIAPRVALVGMR